MSARNHRRPWEPDEDKQLREMVEAGKSPTMIALRLKRTVSAVHGRLTVLDLRRHDRVIAIKARLRHVLEFQATPQFLERRLCLSRCDQSGNESTGQRAFIAKNRIIVITT